MAGMTKLQAVNEIMEAVGEYPADALDTDGVSTVAQAERILDRENERVQAEGWHQNKEVNVTMSRADVTKMAMVIAAGAWVAATKTLTKTAAFASYTWQRGDQLYVSGGTGVTAGWYEIGARTSDNAIIMLDSIATANAADITTTLIGWENAIEIGSDILSIDSYGSSSTVDTAVRDAKLWDKDNNTFSFDADVVVELIRKLDFTDLTPALQNYIVAVSAVKFQRREIRGQVQDSYLSQEMDNARIRAKREDNDAADHNILNTTLSRQVLGVNSVYQEGR